MRLRLVVLACMTGLLVHIPIPAVASCTGHEPLSRSIGRESVVAVFSGTVVGVQSAVVGEILTIRVDTVWKGEVSRTMLMYHPNGLPLQPLPSRSSIPPPTTGIVRGEARGVPVTEFLPFYVTRRYVVVARQMTAEERAAFQLDQQGEYLAVDSCDRMTVDEAQAIGDLERVGPGRAPR